MDVALNVVVLFSEQNAHMRMVVGGGGGEALLFTSRYMGCNHPYGLGHSAPRPCKLVGA